nr:plastidial pyruvate kinase 4, chloroplastic [Ipomoea batatas]
MAGFLNFISFYLYGKCSDNPHNVHFKIPRTKMKMVAFKITMAGFLKPPNISISNQDEAENWYSRQYTVDPVMTGPEDSENSWDSENSPLKSENRMKEDDPIDKLKALHLLLVAMEQKNASVLKLCHRNYLVSAVNLVHYLALKGLDIDRVNEELSPSGLVNLDNAAPHVLASLSAGIHMLEKLKSGFCSGKSCCVSDSLKKEMEGRFSVETLRRRAASNMERLLGTVPGKRATHVMVTVGQEGTESETLVADLIEAGASVIRINCAHGSSSVWGEIVERVRRNSKVVEKPCRVLMDLAGPKIRTDRLKGSSDVVKISPKRNGFGNVMCPARVWLIAPGTAPPSPSQASPDEVLYVDGQEFLGKLKVNDEVNFFDARGKKRTLRITRRFDGFDGIGFIAECHKTAYIESGAKLCIKGKTQTQTQQLSVGNIVDVPQRDHFVRLRIGDWLLISKGTPKSQNEGDKWSFSIGTHRITCSSTYLFDSVKPGEPIAFDDGKIWGTIKATSKSEALVSITNASRKGTKLGPEKSINIPESNIEHEGLTAKDLKDLDCVSNCADMVGVSFVSSVADIAVLRRELETRELRNMGVVLKIETKGAVENLPLLLLEAMRMGNPLGVMIARGDLAVECGWEKLADIQDEIIRVSRAAHIPVIWATQVLESVVKSGVPTRAELTDVAIAKRANCIMLNKGKHVVEAVQLLCNILSSPRRELTFSISHRYDSADSVKSQTRSTFQSRSSIPHSQKPP